MSSELQESYLPNHQFNNTSPHIQHPIPPVQFPIPLSHFNMAPKRSAREPTPSSTSTTQTSIASAGSVPAPTPSKASLKPSSSNNQSPQEIALGIWQNYLEKTPQRTKLIDVFMSFLVVVGVLQFVYCVIAGNYVSLASSTVW